MGNSFWKYLNKVRKMFLLYSIDNYIHFIKEFRQFELFSGKVCVLKIQIIFNHDNDLSERMIKKWKEMDNDFTRFFLNLNTLNQKEILRHFQIPIGKNTLGETGNTDSPGYDECALLPNSLEDINHLLFYFNNRALDQPIANIKLPHLPEEIEKKLANGSNWANYIVSLSYKEQAFVLFAILQN